MKTPEATERKCSKSTLTMPLCMCILHNKELAVDSTFEDQVKIFSSSGKFVKLVADGGTANGKTDLIIFDVETSHLVKRMEMADAIKDKQRSKCRFLTSWKTKLLITDLGMDCVFTLDLATTGVAV